ncbi:MAG: OmpA family protein [Bacteroidetes bacterium]|nr:OmpA family protein [Bacteroidota bacterium]
MKKILFTLLLVFSFCQLAISQDDAAGCKDHSLFNRMPNYTIGECSSNYGVSDLVMENGESKTKEGYKTVIMYNFNTESGKPNPSFYQVFKNYENALSKYHVKKVYQASQYGTLYFKVGEKTVWLGIEAPGETAEWYSLTIIEIEEMKQDISASDLLDALNKDGHIALYINFQTNKSDIKPESEAIITQIAEMLSKNENISISIEGHTDNVGTPSANQTLSENRAKSVFTAVVNKGIDPSRLSTKGYGQTKPIADNSTEEGRFKNRRVEIVKK